MSSENNYSNAPLAQQDLSNLLKNIAKNPLPSSTLEASSVPPAPDRSTYERRSPRYSPDRGQAPAPESVGYYAPPPQKESYNPSTSVSSSTSQRRRDEPFYPDESLAERTLFVSNMPDSVSRGEIKKAFESYGTIDSVNISRNTVTGTPFCFLAFLSPRCVDAVIEDRVQGKQFYMRDKKLSVSRRERKGPGGGGRGGGGSRNNDRRSGSVSSGQGHQTSSDRYSSGSNAWEPRPRHSQGSFGGNPAVVRLHDIPIDWHLGHLMERVQSFGTVRDTLFKWDHGNRWQGFVEFEDVDSAERLSRESLYLAQTRVRISMTDLKSIGSSAFSLYDNNNGYPGGGSDFRGSKRLRESH